MKKIWQHLKQNKVLSFLLTLFVAGLVLLLFSFYQQGRASHKIVGTYAYFDGSKENGRLTKKEVSYFTFKDDGTVLWQQDLEMPGQPAVADGTAQGTYQSETLTGSNDFVLHFGKETAGFGYNNARLSFDNQGKNLVLDFGQNSRLALIRQSKGHSR